VSYLTCALYSYGLTVTNSVKGKNVKAFFTRYQALGPQLIPVYTQSARSHLQVIHPAAGLLISNVDVDIIDDTFDVSISTILSYKNIDRGINDTLLAFLLTLHRYFSTDMQDDAHNFLSFRAFVRIQRFVEILDERRYV